MNSSAQTEASLKQVWLLFVLSAIGSWTIWLWQIDGRKVVSVTIFGFTLWTTQSFLKLVAGNCLPGILALIIAIANGKTALEELLSTFMNWRVPAKWYALAFALPTVVFLFSLWVAPFFVSAEFNWPPVSTPLKIFLVTLPFGNLWEEIAWRAFSLRKLLTRFSRVSAALVLGAYWSTWHIPLWLVTLHLNQHNRWPVISMAFLNLTAWSVIFTFFYERSRESLPVTMALHGAYGAISIYVAAVAPETNLHVIIIVMLLSCCIAVGLVLWMILDQGDSRMVSPPNTST